MAELHESILLSCRKKFLKKGWHESKTPIRGYLPDLFARKLTKDGYVTDEVILEAEIESTIHTEHTAEQLVYMDEYISRQAKKGLRVMGFLAIPRGRIVFTMAKMILFSQFPEGSKIKILQV